MSTQVIRKMLRCPNFCSLSGGLLAFALGARAFEALCEAPMIPDLVQAGLYVGLLVALAIPLDKYIVWQTCRCMPWFDSHLPDSSRHAVDCPELLRRQFAIRYLRD